MPANWWRGQGLPRTVFCVLDTPLMGCAIVPAHLDVRSMNGQARSVRAVVHRMSSGNRCTTL